MDRASNILKVISLTKKALHLGLFIGFVLLSSFALKDLISHDKTIQVNKINQNYVSNFPSFTVCFDGKYLNHTQLQNGAMNQTPNALEIIAFIKLESEKDWTFVNMLNSSEFNEYFDGTWDWLCKTFSFNSKLQCLPCFTIRINFLKHYDVEKGGFHVKMKKRSENELGLIVSLHDANQSLLLKDSFDWSNTFLYNHSTETL